MSAYILRRVLYALPILIGVNVLTFVLLLVMRRAAPWTSWTWGVHPTSLSLRHAWVGDCKPNLMTYNTLKYRSLDAAPLAAIAAIVALFVLPAAVIVRRRRRETAL